MAIGSACVWEVRTGGHNNTGGGYTSGGVDKSQQDAIEWALTDCTSAGAGNTVLNANAHADMIGNVACCVSGTNFTTSEFFEVLSVSAGVSITFGTSHAGASICTGAGANGVINIGGAHLIGGSLDDEWFDSIAASNKVYVKTSAGGVTYTLGEAVSMAAFPTATTSIFFESYLGTRGTIPIGDDRPLWDTGDYGFVFSPCSVVRSIRFTMVKSTGIQNGGYCVFVCCKANNTYLLGDDFRAFYGETGCIYILCEGISQRGSAFVFYGTGNKAIACYAHDSKRGILTDYSANSSILHCIVDSCQAGIDVVTSDYKTVLNTTIRNCITGIAGTTSEVDCYLSNLIAECIVGAQWTTGQIINWWDFNCFYNNVDNTNVTLGKSNLVATNPLLLVALVSGTDGATNAAGTIFTAASNPFNGVTTSDCLLIKAIGTGATLGVYSIVSVDSDGQITINRSAGASKTGITYGIVKGTDFTLDTGSPCFDTGLQVNSSVGIA